MSRRLELMPDTGHYYYFFPLALEDEAYRDRVEEHDVPESTGKLREVLLPLETHFPWTAAPGHPWMRLKVGRGLLYKLDEEGVAVSSDKPVSAVGIWLAVETNTGDDGRGYRYVGENEPGDPEWVAEDESQWPKGSTVYVSTERQHLKGEHQYDLLALCPALAEYIKSYIETLPFSIKWLEKSGEPFAVDLIVDFGNSRTVALLLEDAKNAPGGVTGELNQMCRPLAFSAGLEDAERGVQTSPSSNNYVIDSWFILRQPEFSYSEYNPKENPEFSPDRFHVDEINMRESRGGFLNLRRTLKFDSITRRIPHMFVEMSPATMGPGSHSYFMDLDGAAYLCALSSPKRYAWDKSPVGGRAGSYWHMMSRTRRDLVQLSGEIMAFMPINPDRRYYSDPRDRSAAAMMEASPPDRSKPPMRYNSPIFPKSDGLVWTALSIIEQAERVINGQSVRVGGAKPRRYLDNIVVTFPSGWTQDEIENYHRAWIYARNIFYWSRYRREPDGRAAPESQYPKIKMHIDEAVASQLPVIYSEIRHLGNDMKLWLQLFGRERKKGNTCRVMSIDIGGGTMDTAVVEYSSAGLELVPRLLFTDSSTRAGDKLVKMIIDEVLIPYIIARNPDQATRTKLKAALTRRVTFADVNKLVASVKSVFMPIVVRWLADLSTNQKLNQSWTPRECGVDREAMAGFNKRILGSIHGAEVLPHEEPIEIEYNKLNEIVHSWISDIAEAHARYLAAFQCDLVVVTGKPSEIKTLRAVLEKELPIEPYRIIFVNGYYAGDWLPLGGIGRDAKKIQDAKFVTVVGAALSQAFERELIPQLFIRKIERGVKPLPNWWFRLNDNGTTTGPPLLHPEIDEVEIDVSNNMVIGRVRFPGSEPERVYEFKSRYGQHHRALRAKLRRVLNASDGESLLSERLELVWVEGYDEEGRPIDRRSSLDEFELYLNTLGGNYWLDEPKFEVSFED